MTTTSLTSTTAAVTPTSLLAGLVAPSNFPVVLDAAQQDRLLARVAATQPFELTHQSIVLIGFEAEASLNKVLDEFLARVDAQSSPQMFELVQKLDESVTQEDLPGLANQILNGKAPLLARLMGIFSPKHLRQAANKRFAELGRIASGKSKKLSDIVQGMEQTLRGEMTRLHDELVHMDTIKEAYRKHFVLFAEDTVVLHSLLGKARDEFARLEPELKQDVQRHQDALDLLQALESRALAVEGTLTALPADQLVTRQLQNAGVATLQELATTMAGRFARIRMTLLKIHGARMVQDVQRLGAQGAELDANLAQVSSVLMKDVVQKATNAPGDNRLAQANQLTAIVNDTRELVAVAQQGREANAQKFKQARELMATARQNLLTLGKEVNPNANVAPRAY